MTPRSTPFAVLLVLCSAAILAPPATAITLTNHLVIPHGVTHEADMHRVVVTTVAPPDSDDDGCPNDEDSYGGPGCNAPKPTPVAQPVSEPFAPTPAPTSTVAPSTAGSGCVGMEAESGSAGYSAYNPSSGATGCYQILPSTAANYGCSLSTPGGQDACMESICADVGNSAWTASGATPCG